MYSQSDLRQKDILLKKYFFVTFRTAKTLTCETFVSVNQTFIVESRLKLVSKPSYFEITELSSLQKNNPLLEWGNFKQRIDLEPWRQEITLWVLINKCAPKVKKTSQNFTFLWTLILIWIFWNWILIKFETKSFKRKNECPATCGPRHNASEFASKSCLSTKRKFWLKQFD